MPDLINYNGTILPAGMAILTADNRGFRYGDGLFETMLVREGRVRLGEYHFQRLFDGMKQLRLESPSLFTPEHLEQQILELCTANGLAGAAGGLMGPSRARVIVFRGEGGLSDPAGLRAHYIIQTGRLDAGQGAGSHLGAEGSERLVAEQLVAEQLVAEQLVAEQLVAETAGLSIDVFPDGRKSCDALSNIKSNNYLLYTMAALYAREKGLDDCLVLNSHERLADSTIANLFYYRNNVFYTPPLSEGCVAGVMRRYLVESLPLAGFEVVERPVYPEDLEMAEEVFLTNALRGIRWVRSFRGHIYSGLSARQVCVKLIGDL